MGLIGFELSIIDNNTTMFDSGNDSKLFCQTCGSMKNFADPTAVNPQYKLTKGFRPIYSSSQKFSPNDAVSSTYDNRLIASIDFKTFCQVNGFSDVHFQPLPDDPFHFGMMPLSIVSVDQDVCKVEFGAICPTCRNYDTVVFKGDLVIDHSGPLANGFYRTDLSFGSGNSKSPLVVVGLSTKAILAATPFEKIGFNPVYGKDSRTD